MNICTKNLDQDEAAVLVARLGLHEANCRAILGNATGEVVPPSTLAKDDDLANIALLVKNITILETKLGDKAPTFNFTAARPASKAESSGSGHAAPPTRSAGKNATLTEKVLAARGAKSLSELAARHQVNPVDKNS